MSAEQGVAGVRLEDGRQVFVAGLPADVPEGARVHFMLEGVEQVGAVSIPPALVVWCDPEAQLGVCVALEPLPETLMPEAVEPPLAQFLAEDGAPDADTLAKMLGLAWEDRERLDG